MKIVKTNYEILTSDIMTNLQRLFSAVDFTTPSVAKPYSVEW
jgi:hypothetical protein